MDRRENPFKIEKGQNLDDNYQGRKIEETKCGNQMIRNETKWLQRVIPIVYVNLVIHQDGFRVRRVVQV